VVGFRQERDTRRSRSFPAPSKHRTQQKRMRWIEAFTRRENVKAQDTGISMTRRTRWACCGAVRHFVVAAAGWSRTRRGGSAEMPLKRRTPTSSRRCRHSSSAWRTATSRWDGPGGTAREVNTSNFPISRMYLGGSRCACSPAAYASCTGMGSRRSGRTSSTGTS